MSEKRVGDVFNIRTRFLRSAHLERDFDDPGVLSGYVVTDFTRSCLGRVASGLKPRSGQRAWRMTGDFGCGKSSFALLLAHWFSGHHNKFPPHLRKVVDYHQFGVPRPKLVPALVTCSRQGLASSTCLTMVICYRPRNRLSPLWPVLTTRSKNMSALCLKSYTRASASSIGV